MKLLALSVCLMATFMAARADGNFANAVLHGASMSTEDIDECYQSANLDKADLITNEEIAKGAYNIPENAERVKKNGCFASCILEKRGLIVDTVIQKEKLYAKDAHSHLNQGTQAKIYAAVDRCVQEAESNTDLCDKSFSLIVCLWKPFL